MDSLVAYCGYDCTKCPAFLAYKNGVQNIDKEALIKWASNSGSNLKPEEIICSGCTSNDEIKFKFCYECKIRECASSKDLVNCGYCENYPCSNLDEVFSYSKEAKYRLDNINMQFLE
ncbi:MAG: DUF3795 domain-containing protein [Spirochaetes bacterium]|nr:DUF3795 domain-containing protein [Spirochaetota bacterium]